VFVEVVQKAEMAAWSTCGAVQAMRRLLAHYRLAEVRAAHLEETSTYPVEIHQQGAEATFA
jgi:hypothetical protein